jgi:hypothetical protein
MPDTRQGRLLRFLFQPPRLGHFPVGAISSPLSGFAARLATSPPDLVTHLGMVRANAYFATGCPPELCDHAAARDLWQILFHEVIGDDGKERLCH